MSKKAKSPWKVFLAIILAVFFGMWMGQDKGIFGVTYYSLLDTLATIFLNALTLVVVPLVSSSIITGISRIGNDQSFKRIGAKMFLFYFGTSLMAILIGLFFVNIIHPGTPDIALATTPAEGEKMLSIQQHAGEGGIGPILNILLQIVPSNVVDAFSSGQMMGLIFFSLIFGYALSKIEAGPSSILQGFWQGIFQTMIRITHIIMKFLPYGVFCLVAKVFATTGLQSLQSLALFTLTVLLGLATFMLIGLPLLLKFVGKIKPFRHLKAMSPALITAFSTSSSSATLPVTIECVEKRSGVSNRICSLVIPLGTSINMSGSALYECVAAMFVAQVYGIDISYTTQFLIVLTSLIASVGVAGIPSASLVAILVILRIVGLPLEAVGLFIAVDRLLDMCRTMVNVFSDSCCAVLVARAEGEHILQSEPEPLS